MKVSITKLANDWKKPGDQYLVEIKRVMTAEECAEAVKAMKNLSFKPNIYFTSGYTFGKEEEKIYPICKGTGEIPTPDGYGICKECLIEK
jgi:hypothetical protein